MSQECLFDETNTTDESPAPAEGGIELCANLWIVVDAMSKVVQRFAVRLYALGGDEAGKKACLKSLACSDYLAAAQFPVPSRFKLVGPNGETIEGIATVSTLHSNQYWKEAVEEVHASMPPFHIITAQDAVRANLPLPKALLFVETILMEDENGALTPA
jgi:hypothetical protein